MKKFFLWVCLIALLFIVGGCHQDTSHSSSSVSMSQRLIPFVIFLQNTDGQSQSNSDNAYLCHFDATTGKISIDDTSLFRRIIQGEYYSRIIWDGEKKMLIDNTFSEGSLKLESINTNYDIKILEPNEVNVGSVIKSAPGETNSYNKDNNVIVAFENGNKQILSPPLPSGANQPQPLLLSGDEHNYRVLITFDVPSSEKKNEMAGKLLIADVKEGLTEWKEVRGEYCSFIAGAGSSVAGIGENVYITSCGGNVSVLNLQKDSLVLEEYKPVNDLLLSLGKFGEAPIQPHFGAYKDYLLVTVQNSNEKWLWILKDDVFLGRIRVNTLNNQIDANLAQKDIETMSLPSKASTDLLQLPEDSYGAWK